MDSSKEDGNFGCAWFALDIHGNIIECMYKLVSWLSNNQPEKLSILKALKKLVENTSKVHSYVHIT